MNRKGIIAVAICFAMTLAMAIPVFAGRYDDQFTGLTWSDLVIMDGSDPATNQMRGFGASQDGKYVMGGTLQNTDKGIYRFDSNTGAAAGFWVDDDVSYLKGIGSDDRGNVYIGITNPPNADYVQFAVLDEGLNLLSTIQIDAFDGEKVGVNGIDTQRFGDTYKTYFITNYGPNYIYCYDVTDPKNPVPDTTFGDNGRVDLKKLTNNENADCQYLSVDTDGVIYMTAALEGADKGDHVVKIAADGKSIIQTAPYEECYGTWIKDDYLIVSSYQSADSVVYIINKEDLSPVTTITIDGDHSHFARAVLVNDRIYIADQGYNGGDRILVSSKLTIPVIEEETQAEEPAPVETAAPAAEAAPAPAETAAPAAEAAPAPAAEPAPAPVAAAAPAAPAAAAQTGDMAAVAVLAAVAAIGCAVVIGKRK